jgi:hypothetical protein
MAIKVEAETGVWLGVVDGVVVGVVVDVKGVDVEVEVDVDVEPVEVEPDVDVEVEVELEVVLTAGNLRAKTVKCETCAETSLLAVSTVDDRACQVEPSQKAI